MAAHDATAPHTFTYINRDAVDKLLLCPISMEPLVEPVVLNCEHTFSRLALTESLRHRPACPTCRAAANARDFKPASLIVRSMLDNLQVSTSTACASPEGPVLFLVACMW